jgi:DNA-binding transcriptional ArsR family regulator
MSVISSASSFRDRSIVFDEVKEAIGQIERTLDLMSFGTYTTSLNFEILKKEYRNLLLAIEGDKSLIITEPQLLIGEIEKPLLNKLREDNGHKGHEAVIKRTTTNNTNNVHYENSSRSTKIIDFLKTKESGTVKDIASIFNGISEKTVQRDLLALAAAGKLLAKGEKRWRTYSLVK